MPEIRPRADVLAAGQRRRWEHENQHRKTVAVEQVIKVVGRLTMTAWLALEGGLLIRGQVHGKGGTAQDQGTLWLNFVIITAAVVAAEMPAGVVSNAAAWPSRLSAAGLR